MAWDFGVTAVWNALNIWGQLAKCRQEHAECHEENLKRKMEIAEQKDENLRLRELLEIGTLMIDGTGKIIHAGPNFCKMSGYTQDELLQENIDIIIPFRIRTEHHKWVKAVLADEHPFPYGARELEMRSKTGQPILVRVSLTKRPSESGITILADVQRRS